MIMDMLRTMCRGRLRTALHFGLAGMLSASAGAVAAQPESADAVFRHGHVYTVDAQDSVHEALAVRGGRIVYVGDDAGVQPYIGADTRVINLQGRMLMPGLVDGHMHPLSGGAKLTRCNLEYKSLTVAELQARIQRCIDEHRGDEPDKVLQVANWFRYEMRPKGVAVTRATLDALNTHRPILIDDSFGHTVLANSRALALAGITRATRDPATGRIEHDSTGEPTGILEDDADAAVRALIPEPTAAERVTSARTALASLARQGVTSFLDASASPGNIEAFATVAQAGGLTARAHFAPLIAPEETPDPQGVARAVATVTELAHRYDSGALQPTPAMTLRNAKLFLDGVINAPANTGAMLAPYFENQGTAAKPHFAPGANRGPAVYFPAPILRELLLALARAGIDPHMHTDGDRAVREALDGVQALRKAEPGLDIRPALAHCDFVDPQDYPRFAALNAIPVLSFQWDKPGGDSIEGARDTLGPVRHAIIEPAGVLAKAGARIAYGSDWPVDPLDEWFALKVGVTRTAAPGAPPEHAGRLGTDPGLSRATVIRAITMNAAYELHQDAYTGSLEVGKFADLIVLDRNFFTIPAEDIANVRVLETMVGGRVVYESGELARVGVPAVK
jgi:predicted amidohydrolase YtcJ